MKDRYRSQSAGRLWMVIDTEDGKQQLCAARSKEIADFICFALNLSSKMSTTILNLLADKPMQEELIQKIAGTKLGYAVAKGINKPPKRKAKRKS